MTSLADPMPRRWLRAEKFASTPAPGWASHIESLIVVAVCGVVICAMTGPAFTGFFYGEDFITRSLYLAADENFFKAIFTPFLGIFLRPSAVAWSIGTQLFLPWDPLVHHWRNFLVLLLCLWVLHRIMVRLTDLFAARAVGIFLFAISKVQLTIIGLINCIDNVGTLLYSVTTILFLVRYIQRSSGPNYWLALGCFGLSVASRDANVMFTAVPIALLTLRTVESGDWSRAAWRALAMRLAPFVLLAVGYLTLRIALVGTPNQSGNPAYALHFDLDHILLRLKIFLGNLVNLSFGETMATGQGDLSTALGLSPGWQHFYWVALPTFMVLALAAILAASLRRDLGVLLPLVWSGALLGPTLLINNIQIYYILEPVAALGLFVALGIDRAGRARGPLIAAWSPLLVVVALNGYFSARNISSYAWRWVADNVQNIDEKIFRPHRGEAVTGLVLIVDNKGEADFFVYMIDPLGIAKDRVPMLNALLSPSIRTFRALEFSSFAQDDLAKDAGPVLVYRVDPASRGFIDLTGRTIEVASADVDGRAYSGQELATLLARKSTDAPAAWTSDDSPMPHTISFTFGAATPLGSARLVNPSDSRIDSLEVQISTNGIWKTVYEQSGLRDRSTIDARWPDANAGGLRLVIKSSLRGNVPSSIAAVQSIQFPENKLVGLR